METTTGYAIKKMSTQFLVTDLNRSIEFYTKQLNFEIDFRYEDFYAGVIKDGCSIHLKSGKPSAEERKNKRHNDDLDLIFSIEDSETLYKDFLTKPVEIIQSLQQMPYGKEFYVADPDGYIISFLSEV